MIEIILKTGSRDVWYPKDYTDYIFSDKHFVIMRGTDWVGFYNLDYIGRIVIGKSI